MSVATALSFDKIPGAQILALHKPRTTDGRPVQGLVLWDAHKTVLPGRNVARQIFPVIRDAGLDPDLVSLALSPFQRLAFQDTTGHDLGGLDTLFLKVALLMAKEGRLRANPHRLLEGHELYYRRLAELQQAPPFEGIVEAITIARQRWPNVLHVICTYGSMLQTELRLYRAGIGHLFDGYVAVTDPLSTTEEHPFPYWEHVAKATQAWTEQMARLTHEATAGMSLRVGLPLSLSKPHPATVHALAIWAGVRPEDIMIIDDDPRTGLKMAIVSGATGVLAAYSNRRKIIESAASLPPGHPVLMSAPGVISAMEVKFGWQSQPFIK